MHLTELHHLLEYGKSCIKAFTLYLRQGVPRLSQSTLYLYLIRVYHMTKLLSHLCIIL